MEENTTMTEQTQAENMGNESEAQGTAGKEGKLFTQDEVNSFVQSRIARMKGQVTKEAQAEYSQKLAELEAREMKLLVKERLSDRGMPKELADIITCADEKAVSYTHLSGAGFLSNPHSRIYSTRFFVFYHNILA